MAGIGVREVMGREFKRPFRSSLGLGFFLEQGGKPLETWSRGLGDMTVHVYWSALAAVLRIEWRGQV